jgi:serine/threonine-protein kinase
LAPGTQVGEYVIDSIIGRGGMGAVYSAHQPLIGKRVAIKTLIDTVHGDPSVVRRFMDEARAVNKIGHPNIIDIFSFGRLPDDRLYFVMELLCGATLHERLAASPLTASESERYLAQICGALGAAHAEHIVHRDLKPENIWITTPKHGEPYVKLLDFGIAKLMLAPGNATATGVVMGTPHYMSPEQCQGHEVDLRTDIYALGVILYEMFTGRLPFEGKSTLHVLAQHVTETPPRPSTFRALPPRLEALILSCLEKSPAARPQSTAELLTLLRAALREQASLQWSVTSALPFAPSSVGSESAPTSEPNSASPLTAAQGPQSGIRAAAAPLTPLARDAPAAESGMLALAVAPVAGADSEARVSSAARPGTAAASGRARTVALALALTALVGLWLWYALAPHSGPNPAAATLAPAALSGAPSRTPMSSPPIAASVQESPKASIPDRQPAHTPASAPRSVRAAATSGAIAPEPSNPTPVRRADRAGLARENPFR